MGSFYRKTRMGTGVSRRAAPKDAAEAYNREHASDWGPSGGQCPICRHRDCFGRLPKTPERWACFSANHGTVGLKGNGCYHGDALDIDAHSAGRSRVEHLRATGYWKSGGRGSGGNGNGRGQSAIPRTRSLKRTLRVMPAIVYQSALQETPVMAQSFVLSDSQGSAHTRPYDDDQNAVELARLEAFEERAGIMEFDGGMSREDAERRARALYGSKENKGL